MSNGFEKMIIQRMLRRLPDFGEMNVRDPAVELAVSLAVIVELSEIQDAYNDFDGDVNIEFQPEPIVVVSWWLNSTKSQGVEQVRFRFNPVRVDKTEDAYAAYERAMSVL